MKQPLLGHLSPPAKLIFLFLIVIVCFFILSMAAMLAAFPLFHVNLFSDFSIYTDYQNPDSIIILKYLQIIQSISLFVLPALVAGLLFGGNIGGYLGLKDFSSGKIYFATILLMFVSLPMIGWMTSLNEIIKLPAFLEGIEQWMKETEEQAAKLTESFLDVRSAGGLVLNLIMIAVIPAIGEELFFRGLLQRLFSEWLKNAHIAILIVSFLFAAIHLQFYGFLPRMILGVFFGYLFYWTRSLWIVIFAHLLNNGSAVIITFLMNRGTISSGYEDFGSTDNGFLIAGSIILSAGLLIMIFRSEQQKNDAL